MAILNSTKKNMRTYFTANYYIPMNQRDYTWEAEQIEDFWQDLLSVITHPDRHHFFGQIVIYVYGTGQKQKNYIIDGQQRTVTSMIFLRALQYIVQELNKQVENDKKLTDALTRFNYSILQFIGCSTTEYDDHLQLHLNFENQSNEYDYYSDSIVNGAPTSEKVKNNPACENMRAAYYYFYRSLQGAIDKLDMNDKIHTLYNYLNSFLDKFEVIYLETNDLGESYVIFETLNARGKDLETADLLKNYVFSQALGNLNNVQVRWKEMIDSLSGLDVTKYIRYYWNARYGLVREKDLYREISANIKTPKESYDLVMELKNNASFYHDACSPDSCNAYTDSEDSGIVDRLLALRTLKATSFIPILLALEMRKDAFSVKDKAAILRAIEVYVFRNATIAGKTANSTEMFFSSIAHNIYEQKLISVNEIVETIKSEMISDEDFKNSFCTFATKTQPYIRYTLLSIHEYLNTNHEINRNPQQVNIEHIMPKTITDAWPGINNETHEKYLWRLGNLALLDDKLNKKASNQSFKDKQKIYKDSMIKPNEDLATKYTEWGPKQIEDRQKELAKIALQIWR
jgi:uncharacterized protein with ParB-like and HNH nuclease domain